MFRFAQPDMLYLLLLIPVIAALAVLSDVLRRRRLSRFGDLAVITQLMPDVSPRRSTYKAVCYLAAAVFMIFALARPQLGSKLREVTREGIEMMLAVDVSNSMLAQDIEPSRLERTKYAIGRLLESLGQDRVGLIAFAGDAFVQLPVTSDYVTARNFVSQLSPNMVSRQGTSIGKAIELAINSFSSDSQGARVIILITDGEDHSGQAMEAVRSAEKQGIKIYVIGIGTPEGSPISIGGQMMKDDQGNMVVSKLDEPLLQKIALQSGGAYIRATNQSLGLTEIVGKIRETDRKQFSSTMFEEYNEQFRYLLAIALALLAAGQVILPYKNKLLARFTIFK